MRLVKITGGLGNQMFIYAFYLRMKKRFPNTRIDLSDMVHYHVHQGYELHRIFRLPEDEFCINRNLKKVLEFLFFRKIYERKQKGSLQAYEKSYLWPLLYFKGFYQSERYFADIETEVREAFRFDLAKASAKTCALAREIDSRIDSVSLHIRRGDYLEARHWENTGSVCQLPYYQNAIAEISRRVENPFFYVFSDDMEWVKKNIPLERAVYIDWNHGADNWQDMMLMSHCRHHIICNSTFSWWGAWLDANQDKLVIAPNRWFRHTETPYIYPKDWITVPIEADSMRK